MIRKAPVVRWGLLYAVLPVTTVLFWLEIRAPLSGFGHKLAQVGVLAVVFSLVWLWYLTNQIAMTSRGI